MNIDKKLLFATPMWTVNLPGARMLNRKLMIDTADYQHQGSWTLFDLPGEGIAEFKEIVHKIGLDAAIEHGIEFNDMQVHARQHVRKPNESDPPHQHPYAEGMVGVYYLKVAENCGDILIHDARGSVTDIWQDPYVKQSIEPNRKKYSGIITHRIKPEEGKFIIIPSYAIHSVEANHSNELRISLIVEYRFS